MRGRRISRESLREQIERDGADFGIVPYLSVFGDMLAGELVPTMVPVAPGLNHLDEVPRDITSVSQGYPISKVYASRRQRGERFLAHRRELAHQVRMATLEKDRQDDGPGCAETIGRGSRVGNDAR
jgi:hypothetical protein